MLWLAGFVQSRPCRPNHPPPNIRYANQAKACIWLNLLSPGSNPNHHFREMHWKNALLAGNRVVQESTQEG